MQILFNPQYTNLQFQGRNDTFWKAYNREMNGIPLKDTILKSISDENNLLGEGLSKKGYGLAGIKDYVIRIYKNCFRKEDLDREFVKPKNDYLNTLEGVVLCIPGKIDIVKKKTGESLGVDKYAERIQVTDSHPLRDVKVTREETLKALNIYEKLKDFPVKSYKQAYLQMKKFCKKTGFQFDIISPNNILIDTKAKKINLIDPVTPKVNKPVHGDNADFSKYHGCDSLYPVICDFIMQKEHLENLTADEKLKWKKSINVIIAKCISAGKIAGFDRNIKQLRVLYERIERFWNTNELCNRYDNFIDMYSGIINQEKTITAALNYKNSEQERIKEISRLDAANFEEIKPVFEKILEAPHQPKVEFPEIINAVLDKVFEYGSDAKSLVPALELLFDKEIFCTTKKRLYRLFIALEPENKKFLDEIGKSAKNPIEKMLFKQEFTDLYKKSGKHSQEIYKDAVSGATIPQELADKLWISRTCTNTGSMQEISIKNMIKAYNYIESVKNRKPEVADLVKLHKIVLADTPGQELIGGRLRTPETDELVRQIFHVTKDPKSVVNDYSASKDVVEDLKKLDEYINKNYDTMDCFTHAANIFSEVIRIHPFLNGNGRAARLFTEEFLLSKGYRLDKWPEEILYRKIYSADELAEYIRRSSNFIAL
ncbi:MAG: Fic family protein [Candidatus Gastranaerophilaceae bacterium]